MSRTTLVSSICLAGLVSLPIAAQAEPRPLRDNACQVELSGDITIQPGLIKVETDRGERMEIRGDDQVFANGEEIKLGEEGKTLTKNYASQIRATIPEIVSVALEGVEVGLTAVTEAIYTLTQNPPPESLMKAIDGIQEQVADRMKMDGDTFVLKGGEIRGLENAMTEFEPVLQDAMAEAVGDMILGIGQSVKDGNGSLTERIAAIAARSTQLESEIESKIAAKSENLGQRAEKLCETVKALDNAESDIQRVIPELRKFDLVRRT